MRGSVITLGMSMVLSASATAFPVAAWADRVAIETLPAPVRATIERETAGGRIKEIDRETKKGQRVYEVEFIRDNREQEIYIGEDGAVIKRKAD
jgi:hypothetical protein